MERFVKLRSLNLGQCGTFEDLFEDWPYTGKFAFQMKHCGGEENELEANKTGNVIRRLLQYCSLEMTEAWPAVEIDRLQIYLGS